MSDMRLTDREYNVITQLVGRKKYGLEIVEESAGLIKRNTVYVLLGRMEEKGLVEGRLEDAPVGDSGPPRRVYTVTGLGSRCLQAHRAAEAIMLLPSPEVV